MTQCNGYIDAARVLCGSRPRYGEPLNTISGRIDNSIVDEWSKSELESGWPTGGTVTFSESEWFMYLPNQDLHDRLQRVQRKVRRQRPSRMRR